MISAKVVADSTTATGDRLTTLEVVMPRYILAEFNTHRMLSKNSASSRAIPFNKMVKEVEERPFIPYAWQVDHKGMQGNTYFTEKQGIEHKEEWLRARDSAIEVALNMNHVGNVTKQLANRLLEPFMYHKVLVSGTEWENFFNLRCPSYTFHNDDSINDFVFKSRKEAIKSLGADNSVEYPDGNKPLGELTDLQWLQINTGQADIHMMFLAEAIYDAKKDSTPTKLKEGEWHIPYEDNMDVDILLETGYKLNILIKDQHLQNISDIQAGNNDIQQLKCKISIARCARLSYQTLGDDPVIDYEKDLALYGSLLKSKHSSPFEHVAKAMTESEYNDYTRTKPEYDYEENYYKGKKVEKGWCRNYRGFIQYRELLD